MPLELLEDSFHLLRRLPASAWAAYFTGAIPFLLAALFSGVEAATAGYTPSRAIAESFLCAALFVWMQMWKARFAAIMRAQLSTVTVAPWTAASLARCLALQCSAQSVKLIAVPLSGLVLIPFAWTVAFFRNVTSLAFDNELDSRQVLRSSARFATAAQRPSWFILTILSILALVVFIDIAILLAVVPGLLKSLTGMENAFTRGTGSTLNFMFFASTAGLTWLVLDPLLQAVYTRLCFQAQSRHTGLDLLAALRRLAPVVAAVVLFSTCARAEQPPRVPPGKLDRSIDKVLRERPYAWKSAYGETHRDQPPVRFLMHLADNLAATGTWLKARFAELKRWIRRLFRQPPDSSPEPDRAPPAAPLRWTVYVLLTAIAIGLVAFLIRGRAAPPQACLAGDVGDLPVDLSGDRVTAADLPEDRWIALANDCLNRGEYRLALRALYLANLAHLGARELLTIQKSKTNRDYERELRRRSRSPELLPPFHENLLSFECSWYGNHPVAENQIQTFERNFAAIRTNREA
jgi:hypothetical protein